MCLKFGFTKLNHPNANVMIESAFVGERVLEKELSNPCRVKLEVQVAAESIKSFVSVVHSIVLQQDDERCLQKKSDQLEKRLKKEMNSLEEMEKKLEDISDGSGLSSLSPKHPLSIKRAKTEAFRKHVESEKAKYLNSVQLSRAMTLNNLQTSLPNVFQALTGFSSVCAQTFEAVQSYQ